ncbi:hypothetical protein D3C84_1023990 [compost metagenome]
MRTIGVAVIADETGIDAAVPVLWRDIIAQHFPRVGLRNAQAPTQRTNVHFKSSLRNKFARLNTVASQELLHFFLVWQFACVDAPLFHVGRFKAVLQSIVFTAILDDYALTD